MRLPLIIALIAVAAPAAFCGQPAVAQTTTTCRPGVFGDSVTCNTSPNYGNIVRQRRQREKEEDQEARERRLVPLKMQIGSLVRSNRCEEARNIALRQNELELTSQVMSMCVNGGEPYRPPQVEPLIIPVQPPKAEATATPPPRE